MLSMASSGSTRSAAYNDQRASAKAEPARVSSRATERLPTAAKKKKETLRKLELHYDGEPDIDLTLIFLTSQHHGNPMFH